ncbi:MAG: hypothetical protein CL609_04625 [Anaerolineaceae bacterium]|nr:hypothetical protein [Anaerolineaceae bacterium]
MAEEKETNQEKPNQPSSPEQKSDSNGQNRKPHQNRTHQNQRGKRFSPKNRQNNQHPRNQKNDQRADQPQNETRNGQNQKRPNHKNNGLTNGNRNTNGEPNNQANSPWGMNPRFTETGIQTRSQRGEFAKNWWARSWLDALENLMQGVRLTRGQHYARLGQIVSMEEIKGGIIARVQGSRSKPYRVTIQLNPLSNRQWEKVFDLLADKAIYVAKLLAGEMPEDIEEVFSEAGVSLFPTRSIDLQTKCTCPDKVTPCKHIAATHYILGDRFDEDPFLLFRMRGRTEEQIMEALRQRRGAEADMSSPEYNTPTQSSETEKPRFPQTLDNFWNIGPQIDEVNVQVKMPNIAQPLLKRLGEPEFASQLTLQGQLEESYNSISQFAMIIAYADTTATENGNGDEE